MDIQDLRKEFAKLLRLALESPDPHRFGFIDRLAAIDSRLNDPWGSGDRSLNSAWNFVDDYFDALGHRFEDVGGIPIAKAREKLLQIIDLFDGGEEIKDESILRFFCEKPRRLRFKWSFPWLYRE